MTCQAVRSLFPVPSPRVYLWCFCYVPHGVITLNIPDELVLIHTISPTDLVYIDANHTNTSEVSMYGSMKITWILTWIFLNNGNPSIRSLDIIPVCWLKERCHQKKPHWNSLWHSDGYGIIKFSQNCYRWWTVSWQQQAIAWRYVDQPSVRPCGFHTKSTHGKC